MIDGSFRTAQPVRLILDHAAAVLARAGIEAPRREARLLVAHALGLSREALIARRDCAVAAPALAALLARRAAREPMALILGAREFWGLRLSVSTATLVPRPETETLIEVALALRPDRAALRRVLDLGTGTGCLLLAALSEYPQAFGVGIDRSEAAVHLARGNALSLAFGPRAAMVCAQWADPIAGQFDLVLSNPPYIESAVIPALMPEVALFEPASALDGGADGLDAYRALAVLLPRLLSPGGVAVLELGQGQAGAVLALMRAQGLDMAALRPDLSGIDRALALRVD